MERETVYLMECGHIANGRDEFGNPVCVICIGQTDKAETISKQVPNLEGRRASCMECRNETESKVTLPFFEYREDFETDSYYCGCYGWD